MIGKSKNSYYLNQKGFLDPVRLFLQYSFGHFDDFVIIASLLKREKQSDVIVFDEVGKILGISEGIYSFIFQGEQGMTPTSLIQSGYIFLIFQSVLQSLFEVFPHPEKKRKFSPTQRF